MEHFQWRPLFILLDISVAKDHPDELKKKWKYVNKQTLVSGIIAGALVCSLLTLILVIKYKNEENSNSSSSKLESISSLLSAIYLHSTCFLPIFNSFSCSDFKMCTNVSLFPKPSTNFILLHFQCVILLKSKPHQHMVIIFRSKSWRRWWFTN